MSDIENKVTIKVIDIVGDPNPIDECDGEKLYQAIDMEREKNKENQIVVDFTGIESFTTAVINKSIAEFVMLNGIDDVVKWMKIKGIDTKDKVKMIKYSLGLAHDKYAARNNK